MFKNFLLVAIAAVATVLWILSHSLGRAPCTLGSIGCSDETTQDDGQAFRSLPKLDGNFSWCENRAEKPVFEREPQTWQEVTGRRVLVYSAYLDRREEIGGPLVRVIASGWQAAYNDVGDVYCNLWYEDFEPAVCGHRARYDLIYPSTKFPEMWVSHFILCRLPAAVDGSDAAPYALSVSAEPCGNASNHLLVLNRERQPESDSFALCLPALYGRFDDWTSIIELIEIHKLLGVDEITFYNYSASRPIGDVLRSYLGDPLENVRVVQWHYPGELLTNYFEQHAALNDCLYRSSRRHRYVAIGDIDEVIVPRRNDVMHRMMAELARGDVGAYLFQHAYFRRNTTDTTAKPYLTTQQSLWRTDVVTPPGKIRCKSLYLAEKALKANIHYPYQLVPGAREHIVDPDVGMLHHYRKDPMESFAKNPNDYRFIEDRYMRKFNEKLTEAVSRRIDEVERMKYV